MTVCSYNKQYTIDMEYSVYYYHSNYDAKTFAFIRQNDLVKVVIGHLLNFEDDSYEQFEFIITMERLKTLKKLYLNYMLSLLLTENVKKLTYCHQGPWMGFVDNVWCISCKKNWKGMYFTKNFTYSYGFEIYPEAIEIKEPEIIYYDKEFDIDIDIKYLSEFIDEEIEKLEKELITIEKEVYKQKKMLLFSSKLKKILDDDSITYINKILLQ